MSMLGWSIVFFIVAAVAAVFGYGGIAAGAEDISKLLFFVFVVMAAVTFVMDRARR
jgi:uncharacterized membrane protein YtjA (UPF0391 family)